MKKMKRFVAAFAATTVLMSCAPSLTWADGPYTGLTPQDITFDKSLVVDEETTYPDVEFTYIVTVPAGAIDATGNNDTLRVLPGIDGLTVDKVEYTSNGAETGDTEVTNGTLPDGVTTTAEATPYKYLTKKATVNLSDVTFTEPGVYRYYIQENSTNQGVHNDQKYNSTDKKFENLLDDTNNTYRTLDVYVQEKSGATGVLEIQGTVLYEGKITTAAPKVATATPDSSLDSPLFTENGAEAAKKSTGFINYYNSADLYVTKKVIGNQGSKDKYFKINVSVTGIADGTYAVDLTNADSTINKDTTDATKSIPTGGATNPASIVVAGGSGISQDFYLKNGQYVIIRGLPENAVYTVTEEKEDYESTAVAKAQDTTYITVGAGSSAISFEDNTTGTVAADTAAPDFKTGFTNTRNGVLPTGIIMSVAPAAIVGIGVLIAIFALVLGGKKKELDEE